MVNNFPETHRIGKPITILKRALWYAISIYRVIYLIFVTSVATAYGYIL